MSKRMKKITGIALSLAMMFAMSGKVFAGQANSTFSAAPYSGNYYTKIINMGSVIGGGGDVTNTVAVVDHIKLAVDGTGYYGNGNVCGTYSNSTIRYNTNYASVSIEQSISGNADYVIGYVYLNDRRYGGIRAYA